MRRRVSRLDVASNRRWDGAEADAVSGPSHTRPREPARPRSPEPVRAYAAMNTARALERLATTPMSAPELADDLDISPRTARRILRRLMIEGYVTPCVDGRRRYRATLRLAILGRHAIEQDPLPQAAGPTVASLGADTDADAHLWIPALPNVCCIVHASPNAAPQTPAPMLGELAPAHANAAGKVLLAHNHDAKAGSVSDRLRWLSRLSPTDPRALDAELRRVRANGHATVHGGEPATVATVAAAVFVDGAAAAAIGVSLATTSPLTADAAARHVTRAAATLGDRLRQTATHRERPH